jgi:hypothetical protein
MFSIAVPSTITLATPGDDAPETYATLIFSHPTDDVSKCQLTLIDADGHVHEAIFNTQGGVVEQKLTSAEEIAERGKAAEAILEAQREKDQATADAANAHELKTADDTTAKDVAWDADHPFGKPESAPEPVPEPQHGA